MASVTYDTIHECRQRYNSNLRIEHVRHFLKTKGFIAEETGSSHTHIFTPDGLGMWTITQHGGQAQLRPREVEGLDDVLTGYFERMVHGGLTPEIAKTLPKWFLQEYLEKQVKEAEPVVQLPGWLTRGVLEKQGLRSDVLYVEPVVQDNRLMCELRDIQTDDYIASVPLPDLSAEDAGERAALLAIIVHDIGDMIHKVETRMASSTAQTSSLQAVRAEKLKKRKDKAAARVESIRTEFAQLCGRLNDLGYDISEGERDGDHSLIFQQRPDFMECIQGLIKIFERETSFKGTAMKRHLAIVQSQLPPKGDALQELHKLVMNNPLVSVDCLDTGECHVPLRMDDAGVPTAHTMAIIRNFVEACEKGVVIDSQPGLTLKTIDGKPYFTVGGVKDIPLTEGLSRVAMNREIHLMLCLGTLYKLVLVQFSDELACMGMEMLRRDEHTLVLKLPDATELDIPFGSELNVDDRNVQVPEVLEHKIQDMLQERTRNVLEALGATIVSQENGQTRYVLADAPGEERVIPAYHMEQYNLRPIVDMIDVLEKKQAMHEHVASLQEYGYRCVDGKGGMRWLPPQGIQDLKGTSATVPTQDNTIIVRAKETGDLVGACDRYRAAQDALLERIKDVYSVELKDEGLLIRVSPERKVPVNFARPRQDGAAVKHALVDDTGMLALKRIARDLPVKPPENKVDGVVHTGQVQPAPKTILEWRSTN